MQPRKQSLGLLMNLGCGTWGVGPGLPVTAESPLLVLGGLGPAQARRRPGRGTSCAGRGWAGRKAIALLAAAGACSEVEGPGTMPGPDRGGGRIGFLNEGGGVGGTVGELPLTKPRNPLERISYGTLTY